MREIVKLRTVAGSIVVSLPQSVLEPVGLKEGDRVIVETALPRRLVLTKEGKVMTSSQRLELELDLLERRRKAIESDLRFKEYQHTNNMPCDEGMRDNTNAILILYGLVRDRDQLDVEISEKRMQLYDVQAGSLSAAPGSSDPARNEKGWYYMEDKDNGYLLAFVNAKGSCSARRFDAESGIRLGKEPNRKGDYQTSFSEYLQTAKQLQLTRQPNLQRDCRERLPPRVLAELRKQITRELQ